MLKTCRICKEEKTEDSFSTASSGKQSHNFRLRKRTIKNQCKSCDAEYARAFRAKNKNYKGSGKITKYPDRALASAVGSRCMEAKQRAKNKQLPMNIDKEYLYNLFNEQKGICTLSGIALSIEPKTQYTLSIDKIDPVKGYVKGNVQWVLWCVNRAKGEMSNNAFINICREVTRTCNDYPVGE